MMKAWTVKKPGSLENLQLVDLADPGAPAAGEIRVALHATSLNYHDLLVATGVIPTADRRILMADGDVNSRVGDSIRYGFDTERAHLFTREGLALQNLNRHPLTSLTRQDNSLSSASAAQEARA